jgi:hypothetical protein
MIMAPANWYNDDKSRAYHFWPDEQSRRLLKLWREGHSASKIAAMMGSEVTKGMVLGKIHRMRRDGVSVDRGGMQ